MVVIVMSCIVAMIMMRTIRKDLAQYESLIVDPGELRGPLSCAMFVAARRDVGS